MPDTKMDPFLKNLYERDTRGDLAIRRCRSSEHGLDGQHGLGLYLKDELIGVSAVSKGISDYYHFEDELFGSVHGLDDDWIVTQMQRPSKVKTPYDYRGLLLNHIIFSAQTAGLDKMYLMSSEKNKWMQESVILRQIYGCADVPSPTIVALNYDKLAERKGFRLDQSSGLFVKDL